MPAFSFELFPPKNNDGLPSLLHTAKELAQLNPAFMTMTFGAGGTGMATGDLALRLQNEVGVPMAAHITYIRFTKPELHEFTDRLWQGGVKRIVALRGDIPISWQAPDYAAGLHYRTTDEFVADLCARHAFDVSVAAYPEKHPDAVDLKSDIEALKKKCAAGASRAITQFFFDTDVYFRFLEAVQKAGITTPVVPGLLPVSNFQRMARFVTKCGAQIPPWLAARFENLDEDDAAKAAAELLAKQVSELAAQGVPHIHFYTLNRAELCKTACRGTQPVVQDASGFYNKTAAKGV
ncbi:MAG TPA: methylenetetrahydrofolate reductase [Alphaproteobacteria bacterium]|nr:methylenetetrahydrofolate reductase [Alphaproteobacteria bacterium]